MKPRKAVWLWLPLFILGCRPADNETGAKAPSKADPAVPNEQKAPDKVASALRGTPVFRNAVRSVAFSPDGNLLAIGTGEGRVRLWDIRRKEIVRTIAAHNNWTFDLGFGPDGTLISGGGDDLVRMIDTRTGSIRETFHDHENDLHGVAVSADGNWLISGSDDTRVLARSLRTGAVEELGRHEKQVTSVAIAADGKLAASSSRDGTVKLWDLQKLKPVRTLSGHTADVMSVAFSPDGRRIASGGYDRTVRIWDVDTGESVKQFDHHQDWVFAVLFSHDGESVFSGCGDDCLRRFRLSDGRRIFETNLGADVADLALSPGGTLLAAGTAAGSVRFVAVKGSNSIVLPLQVQIPVTGVPQQTTTQMDVDAYLAEHERIRVRGKDWADAVAGLNEAGDAFTLHLLKQIDHASLKPDEAEVRRRVIEQIEARRGNAADKLLIDEIGPMLYRTSVADLRCHPIEHVLVPWLIEQLQEQASDPQFRRKLNELSASPPVPKSQKQEPWGDVSVRMINYIDRALKQPTGAAAESRR